MNQKMIGLTFADGSNAAKERPAQNLPPSVRARQRNFATLSEDRRHPLVILQALALQPAPETSNTIFARSWPLLPAVGFG